MSTSKTAERMKKKRKGETRAFLYIERDLLRSENCKKMSGSAFKVYAFLRSKTCSYLKDPEYKPLMQGIKYSQECLVQDTGLARNTIRKAIAELIKLGFIKITHHGCCKFGIPYTTTYRLTTEFDTEDKF